MAASLQHDGQSRLERRVADARKQLGVSHWNTLQRRHKKLISTHRLHHVVRVVCVGVCVGVCVVLRRHLCKHSHVRVMAHHALGMSTGNSSSSSGGGSSGSGSSSIGLFGSTQQHAWPR